MSKISRYYQKSKFSHSYRIHHRSWNVSEFPENPTGSPGPGQPLTKIFTSSNATMFYPNLCFISITESDICVWLKSLAGNTYELENCEVRKCFPTSLSKLEIAIMPWKCIDYAEVVHRVVYQTFEHYSDKIFFSRD